MGLFNDTGVFKAFEGGQEEMGTDVLKLLKSSKYYINDLSGRRLIKPVKIKKSRKVNCVVVMLEQDNWVSIQIDFGLRSTFKITKSSWAELSYICIPAWKDLPRKQYKELMNKGMGLLKWRPSEKIIEVWEAVPNYKIDQINRNLIK